MLEVEPRRADARPADDEIDGTEPPPPAQVEVAPPERTGRLVPMIIGAALLMQTLDATVISNALPTMARSLKTDPITLNLAITAYLVTSAVFLPISTWIADRFGAKHVFRLAIAGFAISSLFCGTATTLGGIVIARMAQGMAGALMLPVGRLVLLRTVPKGQLVRAMSYLTMPALLGPVLGPPIGGFIVTYADWRWIFWINLPLGVLGLVLITLYIPHIRELGHKPLDWKGFALSGLAMAGLVYGFDNLGRSVLPFPVVAAMLGIGVACAALYVGHARRTEHPILDLSLLAIPTFTAASVGGLFSRLIIGASPFLLAMLLQIGFGLTAFEAGMLTFAGAVGALMMKTTAQPIIARFGFKPILVTNALIVAVLSGCYAFFTATTPHWLLISTLLIGGFFRSLQFTALNALGYADVSEEQMSRASSLSSMFQQLARSLGVGLGASLIHTTMVWRGSTEATAADIAPAFAIVSAISLIGLFFYLGLPRDAGAEVAGKPRRRPAPA